MKFNLIFFFANNKTPDFGEIDSYLQESKSINVETINDDKKYTYTNSITHVKAEFIFTSSYVDVTSSKPYNFPGYSQSPFSIFVDLKRPTFFAYEIMPFVTDFTAKFGLYIFDPQSTKFKTPAIIPVSDLVACWEQQNQITIRNFIAKTSSEYNYMPKKSVTDWWQYMFQLESFRNQSPIDVVFPELLILKDNKTSELIKTVAWVDFMPIAIPECEYISIIETKGIYSSMFIDLGVFKFEVFLREFGKYFQNMMILDRKFKVITDKIIDEASNEIHDRLGKIESHRSKKFSYISPENLIDFVC